MPNDSESPFDMKGLMEPINDWRTAICESGLPSGARHVALTLSLYFHTRQKTAYPGAKRLADDTGLTIRTVRAHLQLLVGTGYLQLLAKGGLKGETKVANLYRATVPKAVYELWVSMGETITPVQKSAPTGANDGADGCNDFTPTSTPSTSEEVAASPKERARLGQTFLPGTGWVTPPTPVDDDEPKLDLAALREQRKAVTRKEQNA